MKRSLLLISGLLLIGLSLIISLILFIVLFKSSGEGTIFLAILGSYVLEYLIVPLFIVGLCLVLLLLFKKSLFLNNKNCHILFVLPLSR